MNEPTIWKFEVPVTDRPAVALPKDAMLLQHVHAPVHDKLWIWAIVPDPEHAEYVERTFRVIGTGNPFPLPEPLGYVGTAVTPPFVWHLFVEAVEVAETEGEPAEAIVSPEES